MKKGTSVFLVMAGMVLALCAAVLADCEQTFKLVASDGTHWDGFGSSVAVSGDIAIIGAKADDGTGSAYVFNVTTGSQLDRLTASDATVGDQFGSSVAISGNIAIIGAPWDDHAGIRSGSAYLFDVTTGDQLAKLTGSGASAEDRFGASVAVDGDIAVVGAAYDLVGGVQCGSAYLFDVTTGDQLAKLNGTESQSESFGTGVGICGDIVVIGARTHDGGADRSGAAYLFEASTGDQIAKLTEPTPGYHDHFGSSVAIDGTTVIVGVPQDDNAQGWAGAAYLFNAETGDQIAKLIGGSSGYGDEVGCSVAISGNVAIVGAQHDDPAGTKSGSAYLFDATSGDQVVPRLVASDGDSYDGFGGSVAISGSNALIGADGANNLPMYYTGAAYVFGFDLRTLTVNSGSGDGAYVDGATVPISADAGTSGYAFAEWTGDTGAIANIHDPTSTVAISGSDVEVTATYTNVTWTLTVNSGGGGGNHAENTVIDISANPPATYQRFEAWVGETAGIVDVNAANTSIIIPVHDVEVTATYTDILYTLTVSHGYGSGSYAAGTVVDISADPDPGPDNVFATWTGDTAVVADVNAAVTTVTMPGSAVHVVATFVAVRTLTVTNGTGSGIYPVGQIVAISADPAASGKAFGMWVGDIAYVTDNLQPDTTVTMPGGNISVTAAYRHVYQLTVNSGTGDGEYPPGAVADIEADPAPSGTIFDQWVGDTSYVAGLDSASTSVTMPSEDMAVTATYRLRGDINRDGSVGQTDLDIMLEQWGNAGEEITDLRADANDDQFVGQTDLDVVLDDWGRSLSP
jgi:hypothetical protein